MKPIVTALGICALLFGSTTAYATTYTWDDGYVSDSYWSSANNWNPNTVPGDTDDAVIDNSLTPSNWPVLDIDDIVGSLTMGDGASLDLNGNTLSVDGTLTVSATAPAVDATLGGSGGTVIAETWTFSGTVAFTNGTFQCGDVP